MKAHTLLLGLVFLPLASAALPAQNEYDLFLKIFSQAIKFNDEGGLQRAIRGREEQAIKHFGFLMQSWIRKKEQDATRATLDRMKALFTRVYKCKVLDHVEDHYTDITYEKINMMVKAESNRTQLYKLLLKAHGDRDRKAVEALIDQGFELGRRMEELQHPINAGKVYSLLATMSNGLPKQTLQDEKNTMELAKMFMAQRKKWDWTQARLYTQWSGWVKNRTVTIEEAEKKLAAAKAAGVDESAKGVDTMADPKAKSLVGRLTFKALKDLPPDSFFCGGGVPINWMSAVVQKGPEQLQFFKKRELFLIREGATKVSVALTNASGAKRQRVNAGAKAKPSVFHLDDAKKEPYCMAFYVGGSQTPFAATTSNLAPTKEMMHVYYRSLSSWETEINGVDVVFYDDNCDGQIFTEDPVAFGLTTRLMGKGPKDEEDVACYDSVKIGGKKAPVVPFSSVMKIGDSWFRLTSADSGRAVEAKPMHKDLFKTGTVTMKFNGPRGLRPQVMIIRGLSSLRSTAFSLLAGKSVEVPEGKYEITYGRAHKGKGGQMQMAHVFRGDSKEIEVEAGKNVVLKIGAPFTFDYIRDGDGDSVRIDSLFFRVKGASGEVWGRIQGPTPAPEVIYAKSANGKGAKSIGTYQAITSPELLNVASDTLNAALDENKIRGMGVNVGFFPVLKGDRSAPTVFEFDVPTGYLVGLRVKKHKMFGKILPVFK